MDAENTVNNTNFTFGSVEVTDLTIDSYDYIDIAGAYSIDTDIANFTIRGGVNNVFDDDPPILGADIGVGVYISGNTFPQNYDVLGMYWYITLAADF